MEFTINNLGELDSVAIKFLSAFRGKRLFAFHGEMGSGKTTFIKALCQQLNVSDNAVSPTFTLVNEYKTKEGHSVFHFDFYRIEKLEEVFDIGIEEYFDSGFYCFMEWPEKIEQILPADTVSVFITTGINHQRVLTIPQYL